MNTGSVAIILILVSIGQIQAKNESINTLLEEGKLELNFRSAGGHQGKCIKIFAKNIGEQFFTTKLEAGRILEASNTNQQDLLLVEDVIIALSPGQCIEKQGMAYCYKRNLASPQNASVYELGPMADDYTIKLSQYINKQDDLEPLDIQAAVWILSDCHPISAISMETTQALALRNFVSTLMKLPEPWYSGVFQRKAQGLYSDKLLQLFGDIDFQLNSYDKLTVLIEHDGGKVIKTLMNEVSYGPGTYDLPIRIWVENWQKGTYQIKISGKDGTLKTAMFEI